MLRMPIGALLDRPFWQPKSRQRQQQQQQQQRQRQRQQPPGRRMLPPCPSHARGEAPAGEAATAAVARAPPSPAAPSRAKSAPKPDMRLGG
eukprot:scaffold276_cov548-Prasinococcus_capsulatus_cf.AAC.1